MATKPKTTADAPTIRIESMPVDELVGADYNPRVMPEEEMEKLVASIARFGLVEPIVWNERTGRIVGGHQRAEAVRRLAAEDPDSWEEVEVSVVDLGEEEERILNVGLNGIHGDWDHDKLGLLLADLKARNLEALDLSFELTGLPPGMIEELLGRAGVPTEGLVGDDEFERVTPEQEVAPDTRLGDIIKLGEHLLICGDSTDPKILARLLQADQVDCVITDPPYNVAYQVGLTPEQAKKAKRRLDNKVVENDAMSDDAFRAFLEAAFKAIAANLVPGGPVYVYHADSERMTFQAAMEAAGILHKQTLIWVKSTFALGRQDHHWQHEPALYGWKDGASHRWYGGRDKATIIDDGALTRPALEKLTKAQLVDLVERFTGEPSTVFREAKPSRSEEHPTSKPVALYERHMQNSTRRGDVVFDGFAGYGPMLIAAEKHGRIARLVELNPAYCDAIVRRWEAWSGKTAER